ncbi:hypothetical protein PhCBS80983_g04662 [Powellomyces hirtus]|uniref:RING-type domain-containing protein n=1 Tax=Powellomyces hirtus TaxID=109895 RepID=A0A507DZ75_9FUNG|nr:hypothetical protein PhCBS80983_g04662 [Powellomyces hirtus]
MVAVVRSKKLPVEPKRSFSQPIISATNATANSRAQFANDPSLPFAWRLSPSSPTPATSPPPPPGSPLEHLISPRTASRNAAATTTVFQQAYNYIHPFDTDDSEFAASVTCPLCVQVYATPIILPCCNSRVCSTCVRRWMKTSSTCPWCREDICVTDVTVDRDLKKVVDDLDVCCVNRRQGCEWVGPRKYTLIHVAEECLLTDVPPPRTSASTLFHLSLLESSTVPSPLTTLIPRGASALDGAAVIPSRYLPARIPERTTSSAAALDGTTTNPRRPIPFKKAGQRGSVLVPTRGQSSIPNAGDRFAPLRRSVSVDGSSEDWITEYSDSATSSMAAEPSVLDDEDHLSLCLYLQLQREAASTSMQIASNGVSSRHSRKQ